MLLQAATLALLQGCATKAPPPAAAPARPSPPAPLVRLAVLPPDTFLFSDVATALGQRLAQVQIGGVGPAMMTKVSMEVAQLSLECVSPTDGCFTKVGKFLQVDRLLWGQIGRDQGTTSVKVTVVFLDVGGAVSVGRAEQIFPAPAEAIRGLQDLVDRAVGKRGASPREPQKVPQPPRQTPAAKPPTSIAELAATPSAPEPPR